MNYENINIYLYNYMCLYMLSSYNYITIMYVLYIIVMYYINIYLRECKFMRILFQPNIKPIFST